MNIDIKINDFLFHKMVDEIEDYAIILLDKDGRVLNWNKGAQKIKGYSKEDIIGKSFRLFYTKEDQLRNHPEELIETAIKKGKAVEESWRCRKDGSRFWGNITITTLFDDDKNVLGFSKVTRDLTERFKADQELKKVYEELKKSEELYHKMVSDVEDYAIILLDKYGKILNWNKGAEKIKGYREEEIVGKSFRVFYTKEDQLRNHPEELIEMAIREGKAVEESWRCRKDGGKFWGNITITPLFDDDNNILGFSKVTRDLTERYKADKKIRELNRNLEQKVNHRTAELEAINRELEAFSYSISHDLRAPLRGIHGYTKILLEDNAEKLDEDAVNTINVVLRNTEKMGQLIDDLLAFSRLGRKSLNIREINMNDLVRGVINEIPKSKKQKISIDIHHLIPAMGDPTFIKLVWINLISNAVKYSSTKAISKIEIGCKPEETQITYYVKDNGVGFDMKYYNKLFGVFQRLHSEEEFEGTGVGLASVHKIIKHHGGSLWAEAKEGEGAIFYFKLEKETIQKSSAE
jgi:PAS domain S-box-containing protein